VVGISPVVGRLQFISESKAVHRAELSEEGLYEVAVPPGTYSVRFASPARSSGVHEVQAALVVTQDATVDFTLPGARISGNVYIAGTGNRFDPGVDGMWVKLLLTKVQVVPGDPLEVFVSRDGRYAFHGVGPGRWQLSGGRLAEPPPLEILVRPGDRDVVMDIVLRPREVANR